jgi:excisionase family DNA binding protein
MYTVKEAARVLKITKREVQSLIEDGKFPAFVDRGIWYIPNEAIDTYLSERTDDHEMLVANHKDIFDTAMKQRQEIEELEKAHQEYLQSLVDISPGDEIEWCADRYIFHSVSHIGEEWDEPLRLKTDGEQAQKAEPVLERYMGIKLSKVTKNNTVGSRVDLYTYIVWPRRAVLIKKTGRRVISGTNKVGDQRELF